MLRTKQDFSVFPAVLPIPSCFSHVIKVAGMESPSHCIGHSTHRQYPPSKTNKKDNRQPQTTIIGGHRTRNRREIAGGREGLRSGLCRLGEMKSPAQLWGWVFLISSLRCRLCRSLSVLEGLISLSSGNSADRPWQLSLLNTRQLCCTETCGPRKCRTYGQCAKTSRLLGATE